MKCQSIHHRPAAEPVLEPANIDTKPVVAIASVTVSKCTNDSVNTKNIAINFLIFPSVDPVTC